MTPEQLKTLFDANAWLIMFAVGVVVKYVPWLAKIDNDLIPWINAAGYILAGKFVPPAHAGALDAVPDAVGTLVAGFANASWARLIYEGFGRTLLEKWLKLKKPVVK